MMLHLPMCIVMTSVSYADVGDIDAAVLTQAHDYYSECVGIAEAFGDFNEGFLGDQRRVAGLANDVETTLKVCEELVQLGNNFQRNYVTWSRGLLGGLEQSETSFLRGLLENVGKKMGDVLFVASSDGDEASKFHSLCDDQGPTLVVVETVSGVIFGGYADVSWRSEGNWQESTTAFVFQLHPDMVSFGVDAYPSHALYHTSSSGPTFGGGHDLYISSGALSNSQSYTNGHTFAASGNDLNEGERHFQVKDYVVLKAASL